MLTELYIEALLVDEEMADQVWEVWDSGEIDDATAFLKWLIVARSPPDKAHRIAVKPLSGLLRAGSLEETKQSLIFNALEFEGASP